MKICVDIDNTICDSNAVFIDIIKKVTDGRVNFEYDDITEYGHENCQDKDGNKLKDDEWPKIHDMYSDPDVVKNFEPYDDVDVFLTMLAEHFEIYIVTARKAISKEETQKWLDQFQIPYKELLYADHARKHDLGINFDVSVEDCLEQAENFAEAGCDSYLIAHPWNETDDENITRVQDWQELAEILIDKYASL